jgi:DNA-binding MarR family transcriptional regulator
MSMLNCQSHRRTLRAMTTWRWLDEPEMRAWLAFIQAHALLMESLGRDLKACDGIRREDYGILVALAEASDGRVRMSQLAERSLASPSRLSHQVARLEHDGLVRRETVRGVRGTYALLTQAGRARLKRAAPSYVANVRDRFIDLLGPTGVKHLADLLEPIVEHLKQDL